MVDLTADHNQGRAVPGVVVGVRVYSPTSLMIDGR